MTPMQRTRLEGAIEQILIENMGSCVFWDGDDWLVDESKLEDLTRKMIAEFEHQLKIKC